MEAAGVDTAMMDVIGAEETIREVYHLDRPVEHFEATLEALCATSMEVVPHIVIGLHYGRILGEPHALDIVSRHRIHSLVLVVIMPFYARPGTFRTPDTSDVGRIFLEARGRIPQREVLLGCARPAGDAPARDRRLRGGRRPRRDRLSRRRHARRRRGARAPRRAGARLLLDEDRAHDQDPPAHRRGP